MWQSLVHEMEGGIVELELRLLLLEVVPGRACLDELGYGMDWRWA